MPARWADEACSRQQPAGRFTGTSCPDAAWGAAPAMPAEEAEDNTVDFIIAMQRPDLTKAEEQACARFLVSMTDDSDLHRFARSPTGLVEAVLYYHDFASNLSVVQRAASLSRCTTLSGSHGEWTRTDDLVSPQQRAFLAEFNFIEERPAYPMGAILAKHDTVLGVDVQAHCVPPQVWSVPTGTGVATYSNTDIVDHFVITEPNDWYPLVTSEDYWIVWCPQAGIAVRRAMSYVSAIQFMAATPVAARNYTVDWFGLRCFMEHISPLTVPGRVAFLNGNHGEATNTDDVRARRQRATRQRRQARTVRRRRPAARQSNLVVPLSSCALKYARAIADPFSPASAGACVPTFPSPDSMKTRTLTRAVTVVVGTAGIGGAFLSSSCVSDAPIAAVTTAQYSGSNLVMPSSEVPGDFAYALPNAPFAKADISGGGIRFRCVSYGIKISYSGTQLDMGGTIAGFFDPAHDVVGGLAHTVQTVSNLPYGSFENVDRRMNFRLQTAGVNAHETTFEDNFNPYCPNSQTTYYSMSRFGSIGAIVISGKPGTTFNLEIVQHIEYIGRPTAGAATPTHTDSRGFEMVQQAAGQLATATANNRRSSWDVMRELLAHAASEVAPIAANGISLLARGVVRNQRRALGFH